MALTLIKETGAGLGNSNSYASAADGDAYHDAHLYASAWTALATGSKEKALVMATRLIDGSYQFNGAKALTTQSLQWPRQRAVNPDAANVNVALLQNNLGPFFDADKVPPAVLNATCELARELIKADSSDAVDGEGIADIDIAGAIRIKFDKADSQPEISRTAQLFLFKLGVYLAGRSSVTRLRRV